MLAKGASSNSQQEPRLLLTGHGSTIPSLCLSHRPYSPRYPSLAHLISPTALCLSSARSSSGWFRPTDTTALAIQPGLLPPVFLGLHDFWPPPSTSTQPRGEWVLAQVQAVAPCPFQTKITPPHCYPRAVLESWSCPASRAPGSPRHYPPSLMRYLVHAPDRPGLTHRPCGCPCGPCSTFRILP